ncbi:uncharacterized protein F4817DRAFT_355443 [Daldinia loculata]|uniref:uncharacterized protein n=1 Tax=Daldinia loculata TaxID=103429 RepID=UPI0020C2238B|nr:uncharacterized protein F4817DRAFT_355443 [Daldinia loculata]KAI1641549.1 hypothetical protein F4817DRAFT_355443 [Daldinia loculata]
MSRIIYYDIDWFEDGLHPVWSDSDQEGDPRDVDVDNMDEEISSQLARDRNEESDQGYQQSPSQQRDNITIPIQATLDDWDVLSSYMSYDSYELRAYYDEDDEGCSEIWLERSELVTADTYSWWWFPIVVERVNNELYNWDPWYHDEGYDSYDERYGWLSNRDWEGEREFGGDGFLGWGTAVPDEIDENLPNLANFPPDRDYFIHPRHPTDQWWPLS